MEHRMEQRLLAKKLPAAASHQMEEEPEEVSDDEQLKRDIADYEEKPLSVYTWLP